jgi:hypothetical protein
MAAMSKIDRRSFVVGASACVAAGKSQSAPSPSDQALAQFGRLRGAWPIEGDIEAEDIVAYNDKHYLCLVAHKSSGQSKAPNDDLRRWAFLPTFADKLAFDDHFDRQPGAFNARNVGRFNWSVTGEGYQTALVKGGYLSASGNTYFVMPRLPQMIVEFGTVAASQADSFTLAIGGTSYLPIFSRMVHVNFQQGITAPFWGDDGKAGQSFSDARYLKTTSFPAKPDQKRTMVIMIRDSLLFGFLDGQRSLTLCDGRLRGICAGADQVFTQNHLATFGAEQQYRAWVKTAPTPKS